MNELEKDNGKYLLEIKFDKLRFYCLWGYDKTQKDEPNKLLCSTSNQLIAFSKVDYLIQYIKTGCYISFDEKNVRLWAESFNLNEDISHYDFDLLRFFLKSNSLLETVDEKNKLYLKDLFNALDLIDDYAYYSENTELISKLEEIDFTKTRDFFMDLFVWQNQKQKAYLAISKLIEKKNVCNVLDCFLDQIKVIN
ncbi:hypothetical protein [Sediminitomix flava]|uniref:Uncharacterized protein n=1 Tax=Sediminitomix flava TaxID=379075 RepID=A0A315YQR5_SEDFL|nr:hypothetical protein [Sediminitomix flava]PWJ30595.1 hypothetical protein BC781_1272 [Sediminitomix flava]